MPFTSFRLLQWRHACVLHSPPHDVHVEAKDARVALCLNDLISTSNSWDLIQSRFSGFSSLPKCSAFDVTFVSYNVCSLYESDRSRLVGLAPFGRRLLIEESMTEAGVLAIGLQEARTTPAQFTSKQFHVFASGKHETWATHGCELWVTRQVTTHGPKPMSSPILLKYLIVFHASPRILVVVLKALILAINFGVFQNIKFFLNMQRNESTN